MVSSRLSEGGSAAAPYLIFRSNASLCALPLATVAETMRPLAIEPLAAMPPFVLGVSVIRGVPVPIVDAAKLLDATEPRPPQRVVTIKVGARRVGLAVEGVIGIHALPCASLDEIPPLLQETGNETISAISALDAQLLLVLQSARIVPESVWATIDSKTESRR